MKLGVEYPSPSQPYPRAVKASGEQIRQNKRVHELVIKSLERSQKVTSNPVLAQGLDRAFASLSCIEDYEFDEERRNKWVQSHHADPVDLTSIVSAAQQLAESDIKFTSPLKDVMNTINEVLVDMVRAKPDEASEKMVEMLKNEYIFHTLRSDDKPEVWVYRDGIYVPDGMTVIHERVRDYLGKAYTERFADRVGDKIKVDTYIDAQKFFEEEPPHLLPVQNGIINLLDRTLLPYSPQLKFFSKLPVSYVPNQQCPLILEFLGEVLKDESDVLLIQEAIGWCLYRRYSPEKAVMFTGGGRNGKSKTLSLFGRLLGTHNCANLSLQSLEDDIYAAGNLHGKMANICGDLSKTALKSTGMFRTLTGADRISANRKYKNHFEFINYAKMIFSCNTLPKTSDLTLAFFDRWIMVEFPYTFVTQEEYDSMDLNQKGLYRVRKEDVVSQLTTEEEMSGFLNFAIEGFSRLHSTGSFSQSEGMAKVKDTWIKKSDSTAAFIMDCVVEDTEDMTSRESLVFAYRDYCRHHHLIAHPERRLYETLQEMCSVLEFKTDGVRLWKGIRVVPTKFKTEVENRGVTKGVLNTNTPSGQAGQNGHGVDSTFPWVRQLGFSSTHARPVRALSSDNKTGEFTDFIYKPDEILRVESEDIVK